MYQQICAIAKKANVEMIAIGGVHDHAHILAKLTPSHTIEKVIRLLKCKSSKFINKKNKNSNRFAWQIGYSGFPVSPSHVDKTINYIKNQEEHHKTQTLDEELETLLEP